MIRVTWDNDQKTIIRWDMDRHWTAEEYMQAFQESSDLMATVNHRVDVLGDLRETVAFPPRILTYVSDNHRRVATRDRESNYGVSVWVSHSQIVKAMTTVINSLPLTQRRFHFVQSFEDAYALLETLREEPVE